MIKEDKMKYYKLLEKRQGKLYSFSCTGPWSIEYTPGEKILPPYGGSKISVYAYRPEMERSRAKYAWLDGPDWELWECEAENASQYSLVSYGISDYELRKYWKAFHTEQWLGVDVRYCPENFWADSIKLIKRVESRFQ